VVPVVVPVLVTEVVAELVGEVLASGQLPHSTGHFFSSASLMTVSLLSQFFASRPHDEGSGLPKHMPVVTVEVALVV
jgi:hypothetical protein